MSKSADDSDEQISELRRLVFDEYKLVEEKIDRIGEFLFKIRAWAITANSGLGVAVMSHNLPPLASVVGIIATIAFWRLERQQRHMRDGYSNRAIALEAALSKLIGAMDSPLSAEVVVAATVRALSKTPGIARSSRANFRAKGVRETSEDVLYAMQIILLPVISAASFFGGDIALIFSAVTGLAVLLIKYLWGALSCG